MTRPRAHLLSWLALATGIVLLAATLWLLDLDAVRVEALRLGPALPLVLLVSAVAQLARTIAWAACFPSRALPFWHLARVRLAAEAFSFLTWRGVAGEPLKVLLLDRRVDPREATAAVALERLAFMAFTTVLIGVAAVGVLIALPLSEIWFRIFRAFAIVAAVVLVLSVVVVAGRGRYFGWLEHRGPVGRFVAAVERQFLALARGNPKRLLILLVMDALTYAAMVAEVWVVLWAVGADPTVLGSVAVETFSRVASFASSFIPANLGALEAASVAGVAAIGSTGGAALALARRVRGLFWAAAGLAVYPRPERDKPADGAPGATLLYVAPLLASDASVFARVAGLPIAERVFRAARRHGCTRVAFDAPGREAALARLARRAGLQVVGEGDDAGLTLRVEHGWIPRPGAGSLAMLSTRVLEANDLPRAEREIRAAVFKPTDHNLARFNRRLSLPISVTLLRTPITANQFSVGLLFLGLYSAWLFAQGSYWTGVAGAAVSLAASILDGCDGEIARLKYQESRFGCWLETVTDYTYYFAIFGGMTVGIVRKTGWTGYYWIGAGALAGMILAFVVLLYLRHALTAAQPEKFGGTVKGKFKEGGAGWTKVLAKLSNVATRARMPYGILVLALLDALPLVLVLCLIGANAYWIGIVVRFRALFVGGSRVMTLGTQP